MAVRFYGVDVKSASSSELLKLGLNPYSTGRYSVSYQRVIRTLEHKGEFFNKWEAERKGLAEEFKDNALDRVSDEILTDCCSYERWAKYQCGNIVTID